MIIYRVTGTRLLLDEIQQPPLEHLAADCQAVHLLAQTLGLLALRRHSRLEVAWEWAYTSQANCSQHRLGAIRHPHNAARDDGMWHAHHLGWEAITHPTSHSDSRPPAQSASPASQASHPRQLGPVCLTLRSIQGDCMCL